MKTKARGKNKPYLKSRNKNINNNKKEKQKIRSLWAFKLVTATFFLKAQKKELVSCTADLSWP